MRRRGARESGRLMGQPATEAREALERAWRPGLARRPELARLVTAAGSARESFHRWIRLAQGFSPELVRMFLRETGQGRPGKGKLPVLDPFSGSGTTVIECARQGVRAVGVEAAEPLAFICSTMGQPEWPPLPAVDSDHWENWADTLEQPVHRAALMLAVGRQHTSSGELNKRAMPLRLLLAEVESMIRDDLRTPLAVRNLVLPGDARRLAMIADGSIGGIVTSPPYLSRHDYSRILRPYEKVYSRMWNAELGMRNRKNAQVQIRANPVAGTTGVSHETRGSVQTLPTGAAAAASEAATVLIDTGQPRLAGVVTAYFEDLRRVLAECARVMRPGAIGWVIVGGARLKGVYIPSDLIAAEMAKALGFRVESIRVARDLIDVGRKLGRLGHVAPREVVIVLRRHDN